MKDGKTYMAKPSNIDRKWVVIDAKDKVLGRLAGQIANILRGKHKPQFTPHMDTGDFVIVVNAEKVLLTGKKREQKVYRRHTGYPGGLRVTSVDRMLETRPEEVIRKTVWGMLPKNKLSRQQLTKLKVYAGPDHPHAAQMPEPLEVEEAVK
ncbi:MAG: 50S ribosomal protein L13 [Firmicutes bacterium]|nr:50S ribosomal protein L13 [Bacillota bacterium]